MQKTATGSPHTQSQHFLFSLTRHRRHAVLQSHPGGRSIIDNDKTITPSMDRKNPWARGHFLPPLKLAAVNERWRHADAAI